MPTPLGPDAMDLEWAELAGIAAESIGWLPLEAGAYLHLGKPEAESVIIQVVGIPDVQMAGMNVLLLTD